VRETRGIDRVTQELDKIVIETRRDLREKRRSSVRKVS
jgi:hypothetical protein